MSDGGPDRVSLVVKVWKSSQKSREQRSVVRSIAWLGASFMGGNVYVNNLSLGVGKQQHECCGSDRGFWAVNAANAEPAIINNGTVLKNATTEAMLVEDVAVRDAADSEAAIIKEALF
jgi:hypothetical protein